MSRRPAVTLLLPNRNNEGVLELTLQRLLEHTTYPSYEVIVVDDGSSDDSLSILRRWRDASRFREFTLIEREHGGVVEALNAGLRAAGGELVVQLDADATVEASGWLERLVDFQQADARIGVVTSLVTFDSGVIHAAGINVIGDQGLHDRGSRPVETAGSRTLHSRVHRVPPEAAGSLAADAAEVDAAIGVCMLYPRALAQELGGYDPGFSPVWFDDVDLSLSARRIGLKVFFVPGAHFIHRLGLRGDRTHYSRLGATARRIRQVAGVLTPDRVRDAIRRWERRGSDHEPSELRRLRHHYAYWRQKWGFDLINPDMAEVLARYGDSEVCWAYRADRRAAGQQIIDAWRTGRPAGVRSDSGQAGPRR